jgi:uncharacterized protein (TIGR03437 family)
MVPYELAGKAQASLQLEYSGQVSKPALIPLVASRPEIVPVPEAPESFARHPDGRPVTAASPAGPDSIIMLAVTGLGATQPALTSTTIQQQALPVQFGGRLELLVNGKPAEVLFAGPMPGQAPGLIQLNVRVPQDAPPSGTLELKLHR